jgi:hypothetical protein
MSRSGPISCLRPARSAPDGQDFVAVSAVSSYEAVVMERGWNDPRDVERFPLSDARSYVDGGGVLVVMDVGRNQAASQADGLREAGDVFGAVPDVRKDGLAYLHDEGAREASGSHRFFYSEMSYVADWIKSTYDTSDSLLVASPVLLTPPWADIAASGHPTTDVLVDDNFSDSPPVTPWAVLNARGDGMAALIAAAFSADPLVDKCPDNARWLSALLHLAHDRVMENRQWANGPAANGAAETGRQSGTVDIARLLAADEDRRLERKSSFLTTVPEGRREPFVKHAVLKSLAALLNTEGGHLVIGQADDGALLGLETDFLALPARSQGKDGLQRSLQDAVSSSLGPWVNLPLTPVWHEADGKNILIVVCGPAEQGVWLDGKLYVRQENSTVALAGADLEAYLLSRFTRPARRS